MSCKEFEINIYLYTELSAKEREQLDTHLLTCSTCSALLQAVKQTQELITKMADEKIIPVNAARLTSGIMSRINSGSTSTEPFISRLFIRARIAMTILSCMLMVTFAIEFFGDSGQLKTASSENIDGSIILSSKHFREIFLRSKARRALFIECQSPFKTSQYYLECVKSKMN